MYGFKCFINNVQPFPIIYLNQISIQIQTLDDVLYF